MTEIELLALAAAFVVVLVASLVQASIGFGFAILAVPLMSLIDPRLAPNPQLVIALALTAATVWRERSQLVLKEVLPIVAGRPVGGLIGLVVLGLAADTFLDLAIGIIVLAAVVALASNVRVTRTPLTQAGAGIASGFTSIVAAIGGPPLILLYRDERGPVVRTQLGVVFMIGGIVSIVLRVAAGEFSLADLWIGLLLIPAMLIGFALAKKMHELVDRMSLRVPVLVLSAISAAALIIRSLAG